MKYLSFLILSFLFICCGGNTGQSVDKTSEVKQKSKVIAPSKDIEKYALGGYEFKIDDKSFSCTEYDATRTKIVYTYGDDKSHINIRFWKKDSPENIIFVIYGDEKLVENPNGTYTNYMTSKKGTGNKVSLSLIVNDSEEDKFGSSYSIKEGSLTIDAAGEGELTISFEGMGGDAFGLIQGEGTKFIKGSITLNTNMVVIQGVKG